MAPPRQPVPAARDPVSADHVEAVHGASLRILSEIGIEILGDRALDAFAGAGAMVDAETRRVRLDPDQVEALIATAPSEFTLHARNPARDVVFGGSNVVISAVGGPAFVTDLDRGRRPGNFADFQDYVRVIGALDIVHQEGGGPLEPNDLPVADPPSRHVPDVRHDPRQDLAVPGLRRRPSSTTRSRSRRSSGASTATGSSPSRA